MSCAVIMVLMDCISIIFVIIIYYTDGRPKTRYAMRLKAQISVVCRDTCSVCSAMSIKKKICYSMHIAMETKMFWPLRKRAEKTLYVLRKG